MLDSGLSARPGPSAVEIVAQKFLDAEISRILLEVVFDPASDVQGFLLECDRVIHVLFHFGFLAEQFKRGLNELGVFFVHPLQVAFTKSSSDFFEELWHLAFILELVDECVFYSWTALR